MKTSKIVFTGASGLVGMGLMKTGMFDNAVWLGRSSLNAKGYFKINDYDEASLKPYLTDCDAVVHLAAVTRDRRPDVLETSNVSLTKKLAELLMTLNRDARFIFLSSDLATFGGSPYGRSKLKAEQELVSLDPDGVCLRSSMVAGFPINGKSSSLESLKEAASKKFVVNPGGGRFLMRLLWIEDMAEIINILAARKGYAIDRGVWNMLGEAVTFRNLVEQLSDKQDRSPIFLPVPLSLIIIAGKALATLNPATKFPLDFFESTVVENSEPESRDIFSHLGISKKSVSDIVRLV